MICVLFFLLAAFIPYLSLSNGSTSTSAVMKPAQEKSGIFMCDFRVRQLGNVQRYTVQCSYSVNIPAHHVIEEGNVEPYLNLNGIVCGAVVVAIFGSFISTLIDKKDNQFKDQIL